MGWEFDQSPDTACFTCKSILAGAEVLLVSHYEDDHSWAFLDGKPLDMDQALLVSMSSVLSAHPELHELSDLPPGWTAERKGRGLPWTKTQDG
jgi:hypothetical protein